MTSLDSLPPWVREMLEDLRERAAAVAYHYAPNMRLTVAEIRALPLTLDSAPPEKEEKGPPASTWLTPLLHGWACQIAARFNAPVWLVGSALRQVKPRDVDVIVTLPDEQFYRRYGFSGLETQQLGAMLDCEPHAHYWQDMAKLTAWADQHHGNRKLYIDFKVQDETQARARGYDPAQRIRLDTLTVPAPLPPVAGEEKPPVKKPMDHPDYEFAPGMFNLSKWSRENEPKGPPRFKVGDRVLFTHPLYIHKVYEDCDGTPLFAAGMEDPATLNAEEKQCPNDWILIRSFSADSFAPAPSPPNAEQGEDEGVVKLTDDAEWAGECRKCDCLLCIHVVEERAALLACREALRGCLASAWPNASDHPTMVKAWEVGQVALAQADKVVPR